MLLYMIKRYEREENKALLYTHSLQNKHTFMTITVFVSVAAHVVIAGIHASLLPLPIMYSFSPQQASSSADCGSLTGGVTQTFIR